MPAHALPAHSSLLHYGSFTGSPRELMEKFSTLNLAPPLVAALHDLGYTSPTPIQAKAIPIVLGGHDLMGLAQTGTGKTAAFTLPILNHIYLQDREPPKKGARILILAPTRELVTQISYQVRSYGRKIPHLSVASIYGGVSIVRHIKRLSGGADIIVATPGRLMDLLERGSVQLNDIEILILDEADQMMDMGFIHALKKIVPLLPKTRQTLLFSATMVPKIKQLAQQFLTNAKTVSVTPPNSTADKVEQRMTFVDKAEKPALLALSLLEPNVSRAIVFTRTKHGADRLVKRLRSVGIDSRAIHGNKSQGQRQRALEAFRESHINVLIATDVAARGIDIPRVSHVFNYEIPNVPEQYVHRIGRTARAQQSGIAHAFVAQDERAYLKAIQKLLRADIPEVDLPEDFIQKAQALKSRARIPEPEKPKPQTRKGRGKSRAKSKRRRASKNVDASDKPATTHMETSSSTPTKPPRPHPKRNKTKGAKPKSRRASKTLNASDKPATTHMETSSSKPTKPSRPHPKRNKTKGEKSKNPRRRSRPPKSQDRRKNKATNRTG